MPIDIRGWLRDGAGDPVNGATVAVYASGTLGSPTTAVTATMSTEGSQGRWAFPSLADSLYDLKFTSGTQVRWQKGAENRQYYDMAVQRLLQLPNGVVGAPPLTFAKDVDSGLYRPGANILGVAAGGALAVLYGTLGVAVGGADSAAARLHVQDATVDLYGNEVARLESIAANDNPTHKVFQARLATTDNINNNLLYYPCTAGTTVGVRVRATGRRTGGSVGNADDGAYYDVVRVFRVPTGGGLPVTIPSVGGELVELVINEDQSIWRVNITSILGGVPYIVVTAKGDTGTNVTWHATIDIYEVST